MTFHKHILIASVSSAALLCAAGPALAADAAPTESTVGEVVVTGLRHSLQQAIMAKRNADTIVDVVTADDIGKLPDKNVADALQRLPGINTVSAASGEGGFDENDRVSIRGTNPSLTQTLVNGHGIANGDWFILDQFSTVGRSVSFTLLPSEIVDKVDVFKGQEADLVEGGVAGTLDIHTRKPLDFTKPITIEVAAGGEYGTLANSAEPQFNALLGWKNADSTLGVTVQGFYEERDIRRDGQETLGYSTITAANATGAAIPSLVGVQYPSLIGSSLFRQTRTREGGDFAVGWRPNDSLEVNLDGFYSHLDATNLNSNPLAWVSNEVASNIPTAFKVNNGTLVSATFPFLNPQTGSPVNGFIDDNIDRPNAVGDTEYIDLSAKYKATDRLTLSGDIGYSYGQGLTPEQPLFETQAQTGVSYSQNGISAPTAVSFPNLNTADATQYMATFIQSDKFTADDKEFYVQGDGEYRFDLGPLQAIKFGVRYSDHDRDVVGFVKSGCGPTACNGVSLATVGGGLYPSNFGSAFSTPGFPTNFAVGSASKIQSFIGAIDSPASIPANFFWPGSFDVKEYDTAGYVMGKFSGTNWRGNAGVRIVDTQENILTYFAGGAAPVTTSAFGNFTPTEIDHDYVDVLPSANLSYNFSPSLVGRVSVAKTIARPDYSALGGSVSLTDLILVGNGGNPNLKPVRSTNYNVSMEWYYAPQALFSVDYFYLDLQSYVTFGVHPAVFFDVLRQHNDTYQITSPTNTAGHDQGIEIGWQQPIWKGFGIQANYTYADGSEADGSPLVGDSKVTYNLTGYYEDKWLSVRVAYNYRSSFLVGLDRSSAENQAAIGSLDASVDITATKNISLTFDALNLGDDLLKYYANGTSQPRAIYDNGRQFYFTVRYKY